MAANGRTAPTVAQRYDSAYQLEIKLATDDVASVDHARIAYGEYLKDFAPFQSAKGLSHLSNNDVAFLFRTMVMLHYDTMDVRYMSGMQLDFNELNRRMIVTSQETRDFYDALLGSRMFTQARQLGSRYPLNLTSVPDVRHSNTASEKPSYLDVLHNGALLVPHAVKLSSVEIVVVASPLCHFTQNAIAAIEADATLRSVFRKHAMWIVPPTDGAPSFTTIADWNKRHPHEVMYPAYSTAAWPSFDRWETPTFYFFHGSKLTGEVVGWPQKGNKLKLDEQIRHSNLT